MSIQYSAPEWIPTEPLAKLLNDYIERETLVRSDAADDLWDGIGQGAGNGKPPVLEDIAAASGISCKTLLNWRSGKVRWAKATLVDQLLCSIDKTIWWYTTELSTYYRAGLGA